MEASGQKRFGAALRVVRPRQHPVEGLEPPPALGVDFDEQAAHVAQVEPVPVALAGRGDLEGRGTAVDHSPALVLRKRAVEHQADGGTVVMMPGQSAAGGVHSLGQGHAVDGDLPEPAGGGWCNGSGGHRPLP